MKSSATTFILLIVLGVCKASDLECNSLSVCIALDESGVLCSNGTPDEDCTQFSTSCESECTGSSAYCDYPACPNFNIETKNFAKDFIDNLLDEADSQLQIDNANVQFSVVTFATMANIDTNLTDSTNAKTTIDNIVYSGGFTNHQDAIRRCQDTLSLAPNGKRFMLLFTAGDSTASDGGGENAGPPSSEFTDEIDRDLAIVAAERVKTINPKSLVVTILDRSVTTNAEFINSLASPNLDFTVDDFTDVSAITTNLIPGILEECPSKAPSTIPSGIPSPDPSNSPSRIPSETPILSSRTSPPVQLPSKKPTGKGYIGKGYSFGKGPNLGKGFPFGKGSDSGKGFTFGKGPNLPNGFNTGNGYDYGDYFNNFGLGYTKNSRNGGHGVRNLLDSKENEESI